MKNMILLGIQKFREDFKVPDSVSDNEIICSDLEPYISGIKKEWS